MACGLFILNMIGMNTYLLFNAIVIIWFYHFYKSKGYSYFSFSYKILTILMIATLTILSIKRHCEEEMFKHNIAINIHLSNILSNALNLTSVTYKRQPSPEHIVPNFSCKMYQLSSVLDQSF